MNPKKRRIIFASFLAAIILAGAGYDVIRTSLPTNDPQSVQVNKSDQTESPAQKALFELLIKERASKDGYSREKFSSGWGDAGSCDVRNFILKRDMYEVVTRSETDCTVMQGKLDDPYTAKTIVFVRGPSTSDDVQVDHVVALSNAWLTGAQELSKEDRYSIANDGLNLLSVDGPTNIKKSDSDAAEWLPPNKDFHCRYVARQVAVKKRYKLWVTKDEYDAIKIVLEKCPGQELPKTN